MHLVAQQAALLTADLFKPQVSLVLSMDSNNYFDAQIETADKQISATVNGYYRPEASEILSMIVQTKKPIEFNEHSLMPFDISSYFSDRIKNVRGSVSIKGEIRYKGIRSISGPLKVKLDDLSFDFGNTKVKNLDAVLNLSQLTPF